MGVKGKVVQVIGPVVDLEFPRGELPEQGNAINLTREDGTTLVLETMQHLGDDQVRAVAMSSTDGLCVTWKLKIQDLLLQFQLVKKF